MLRCLREWQRLQWIQFQHHASLNTSRSSIIVFQPCIHWTYQSQMSKYQCGFLVYRNIVACPKSVTSMNQIWVMTAKRNVLNICSSELGYIWIYLVCSEGFSRSRSTRSPQEWPVATTKASHAGRYPGCFTNNVPRLPRLPGGNVIRVTGKWGMDAFYVRCWEAQKAYIYNIYIYVIYIYVIYIYM